VQATNEHRNLTRHRARVDYVYKTRTVQASFSDEFSDEFSTTLMAETMTRGRGRGRAYQSYARGQGNNWNNCFHCGETGHVATGCPNKGKEKIWVTPEEKVEYEKWKAAKEMAVRLKEQEAIVEKLLTKMDEREDARRSRSRSKGRKSKPRVSSSSDEEEDVERYKKKKKAVYSRSKSREKKTRNDDDDEIDDGEERSPPKKKFNVDGMTATVYKLSDTWDYDKTKKGNWSFIRKKIREMIEDEGAYEKVIAKIAEEKSIEQGTDKTLDIAVCRWLLANSK